MEDAQQHSSQTGRPSGLQTEGTVRHNDELASIDLTPHTNKLLLSLLGCSVFFNLHTDDITGKKKLAYLYPDTTQCKLQDTSFSYRHVVASCKYFSTRKSFK